MTMNITGRKDFLIELIEYRHPMNEILNYINTFPTEESDDYVVLLTRAHLISVLNRFLNGDLSAQQVEEWADHIGFINEIGEEEGYFEKIRQTLISLAIMPIDGIWLTQKQAREFIEKLQQCKFNPNDRHHSYS